MTSQHALRHRTTAVLAAALGTCALQAAPAAADTAAADATDDPRRSAPSVAPATAGAQPAVAAVRTVTLAAPVRSAGQTTYRVRSGDTVSHIAQRLGVSQAAIVSANGLDSRAFIREGQVLVVPSAGATGAGSTATAAPVSTVYTVRRGDTLGHIAQRTGTTVAALTAANGLDSRGFIREGQRLSVPGRSAAAPVPSGSGATAATGATSTYTVRSGDTLSHIAARSGVTLSALRSANPGVSDRIQIGQRLAVPARAAGTGSTIGNSFAGRTYPAATVAAAQATRTR